MGTPAVRTRPDRVFAEPRAWTGGMVTFAVLAVGLPMALAGPSSAGSTTEQLLAGAVIVWSSARLAQIFVIGTPRWLSMSFWLFVYVWLGVAPLVQIRAAVFFFPEKYLDRTLEHGTRTQALGLILVGLLFFEIGAALAGRARAPGARPERGFSSHRALTYTRVVLAIAVIAIGLAGPTKLFTSRADFNTHIGFGSSVLTRFTIPFILLRLAPFVAMAALAYRVAERGWGKSPTPERVWLVLSGAATLLINNPITTPRFFQAVVFCGTAAVVSSARGGGIRKFVLPAALLILILFPHLDGFRRSAEFSSSGGPREQLLRSGDFSMFTQITHGLEYVEEFGHTRGQQTVGVALFFLPRSIWPSKPGDTGDLVYDSLGYPDQLNLSAPLWEEFYVEGGLLVLAMGFVAYGAGLRKLENRFLVAPNGTYVRLFVPLAAAYQIFLIRGSLAASVPRLLALAGLCAIPFALATRE